MTVTLRPARRQDAAAVSDLFNRISLELHGVPKGSPADVERFWSLPRLDLDRDVVLAVRGDDVVGYGDVWAQGQHGEEVWLDVRGEGADLILARLEERAHERVGGAPAFIRAHAPAAAATVTGALRAAGYRPIRHSFRMAIDLDGSVPEPAVPDGITVRTLDPERD